MNTNANSAGSMANTPVGHGTLFESGAGQTGTGMQGQGMQGMQGQGMQSGMQGQQGMTDQGVPVQGMGDGQGMGMGGGQPGTQGRNTEVGGGVGDFGIDTGNKGRDAGQQNFAAGPGPVPGSAGGFRDPAQAAMSAKPVVGPGFGPGAVNATPEAKGDYDPLDNSKRTPMG